MNYNSPSCIYHTEIVHNFPGYNLQGKIRRPTQFEIEEALKSEMLIREIDLVKPRVILLLGDTSYRSFYQQILHKPILRKLTDEIDFIGESNSWNSYLNTPVIPIQHSSGANPRFTEMLKNQKLIDVVREILD